MHDLKNVGGEGGSNVYDTIDDDRIETAINNLARRNPNITGDVGMGGEPSPSPEHTALEGHEEIVWAVETTNSLVFTASADKTVRVWDIPSRRCVHVLEEHTRPVLSLAMSTRHKRLFSGSHLLHRARVGHHDVSKNESALDTQMPFARW